MGILRMLLAAAVLCGHLHAGDRSILWCSFIDPQLAVQCFYMISGFYMALVLNEKYQRGQYGLFLGQRYLRLWPTYVLIALLFVGSQSLQLVPADPNYNPLAAWTTYGPVLHPATKLALHASNLLILGQDWTTFFAVDPQTGAVHWIRELKEQPLPLLSFLDVSQAWSLGLEMQFYLLAPLLVRLGYRAQVAVIAVSLLARFAGHLLGVSHDPWNYRFFPFELALFMAGSLAYQHYARFPQKMEGWKTAMLRGRWIFYGWLLINNALPLHELRNLLTIALFFVLLPVLFYATKRTEWDRTIGELSYPFYLSHTMILFWLTPFVAAHLPYGIRGGVYFVVALVFSYLVFRLFESPIENWRHRLLGRKVANAV